MRQLLECSNDSTKDRPNTSEQTGNRVKVDQNRPKTGGRTHTLKNSWISNHNKDANLTLTTLGANKMQNTFRTSLTNFKGLGTPS